MIEWMNEKKRGRLSPLQKCFFFFLTKRLPPFFTIERAMERAEWKYNDGRKEQLTLESGGSLCFFLSFFPSCTPYLSWWQCHTGTRKTRIHPDTNSKKKIENKVFAVLAFCSFSFPPFRLFTLLLLSLIQLLALSSPSHSTRAFCLPCHALTPHPKNCRTQLPFNGWFRFLKEYLFSRNLKVNSFTRQP